LPSPCPAYQVASAVIVVREERLGWGFVDLLKGSRSDGTGAVEVAVLLTIILDRGYGKRTQSIDANITEDGGPVRYYAEVPKKAESTEAWLQSLEI
jgi:hypothetical protein